MATCSSEQTQVSAISQDGLAPDVRERLEQAAIEHIDALYRTALRMTRNRPPPVAEDELGRAPSEASGVPDGS